jgi:hypothetical protein
MPKVGRQTRQQILKISTPSIPRNQSVNRCGVPQIVQPRLMARTTCSGDSRDVAEKAERSLDGRAIVNRRAILTRKGV